VLGTPVFIGFGEHAPNISFYNTIVTFYINPG